MRNWSDDEYEAIFQDHPPTDPAAPSRAECERLGRELDRSEGAIRSQWNDGRSLVLGHRNDAAGPPRDYLVQRGWL